MNYLLQRRQSSSLSRRAATLSRVGSTPVQFILVLTLVVVACPPQTAEADEELTEGELPFTNVEAERPRYLRLLSGKLFKVQGARGSGRSATSADQGKTWVNGGSPNPYKIGHKLKDVAISKDDGQSWVKLKTLELSGGLKQAARVEPPPLTPEPPPWTGGKWNVQEWGRNYAQTVRAVEKAEALAFCYLLSGETRYGEGARKWLLHFASWDPAGSTSMDVNDEAGMPVLQRYAKLHGEIAN